MENIVDGQLGHDCCGVCSEMAGYPHKENCPVFLKQEVRRLRQECAALTGIENDKLNALAEADKLRAERDALKAEVAGFERIVAANGPDKSDWCGLCKRGWSWVDGNAARQAVERAAAAESALSEARAEIEKWKREVEMEQEISANPIYCRKCDSCGEEGCCPATTCLYGGETEKRLEATEAALSEANKRLAVEQERGDRWKRDYETQAKLNARHVQELEVANKRLAEAKRNFERMRRCAYRYSTKLDAAEAKLRAQETALRKAKAVIDSLDTEEDDDNAIADAKAFVEDALAALPQPQSRDRECDGSYRGNDDGICGQCGKHYNYRACGPTHACILAHRLNCPKCRPQSQDATTEGQ